MKSNFINKIMVAICFFISASTIAQEIKRIVPNAPKPTIFKTITHETFPISYKPTRPVVQTNTFRPNTNQQLSQYERDRQEVLMREQALKEVSKDFNRLNIRYSLPSFENDTRTSYYRKALNQLSEMNPDSFSVKKATFIIENAFFEDQKNYEEFENTISNIGQFIKQAMKEKSLNENNNLHKNLSIYQYIADTLTANGQSHKPYTYDFNDYMGQENWDNMFVSKLLYTGKGNCHSMPYLYKILAEEIGVDAHLALAPNHIYIKHRNEKDGWYNTELTSGFFPVDAWIMASGYVHLDGIKNSLYMKALNDKESIALLLVDLAQGYEKKIPMNDSSFILKSVETALKYFPNLITARLLKLETTRKKLEQIAENEEKQIEEIIDSQKAKLILEDLTQQATIIHDLGYRQMPKEMYLDWLVSLREEQEKYINKKISIFKKPQKK